MSADQAKNSSRSFHKAFLRAMESRPLSSNQVEILMVPGIVCAAFAIELGFKALVLREGSHQARGHKLDELFGKLPVCEKASLIKAVGISDANFSEEIKAAANVFVDWRYVYESTGSVSVNLDFLTRLSHAVQNQL